MAGVLDMIMAPPAPSSALATISWTGVAARPAKADAAPNTAKPASSIRLRPIIEQMASWGRRYRDQLR
ncbi:hypothetical protein [Pseudonocardia acaciae]|uniref:hypothetical protein n=1 Tax=Pseudonocardia acaciae TaxID=551276 RepID=UPI000561495B|nr:hypothetical protein [Pseudonocardia acaciae]